MNTHTIVFKLGFVIDPIMSSGYVITSPIMYVFGSLVEQEENPVLLELLCHNFLSSYHWPVFFSFDKNVESPLFTNN